MIDVPEEFRQISVSCSHYPHYGVKLEDYFYRYWLCKTPSVNRQYLPVFWTHLYKSRKRSKHLQRFLNEITVSTFTVVQHARGIYKHRVPPDTLIFAAGGEGHIPIPLVYEIQDQPTESRRTIFAHFAGAINGIPIQRARIRRRIFEPLKNEPGFLIQATRNLNQYPVRKTMQQCVFALCPRGFGKTSFRLYEAMYYGAIPVYIYDNPWLPYTDVLDWCEFSVQCHIDDVHILSDILHSHSAADIRRKQECLREVVPQYFTLEATCRNIVRMLHEE
jgi:hypothetical protein